MKPVLVSNKHFASKVLTQTNRYWDRRNQSDDKMTGALAFCPGEKEGHRWSVDRMTAALFYLDQRAAGLTVKVAGDLASRVWAGMLDHPYADQLTVVMIENGGVSVLPTSGLDLGSGYISGGYVATALVVDVRNLKARIARAVEASTLLLGDDDDADGSVAA